MDSGCIGVAVGVGVPVEVAVAVGEAVAVAMSVAVGGTGVCVGAVVGVALAVSVGLGSDVCSTRVGIGVIVAVGTFVGASCATSCGSGVCEADGSLPQADKKTINPISDNTYLIRNTSVNPISFSQVDYGSRTSSNPSYSHNNEKGDYSKTRQMGRHLTARNVADFRSFKVRISLV
jgi:hypothetical protein